MNQERRILPLPSRTTSLLRSSIILPSFPSIASELVYNSLDAQASSIHLTVDLATWSIHCKDNGNGISGQELGKLDRYSTSKVSSTRGGGAGGVFGFRGEALESMQDLGMLQITSRASDSDQTFEIIKRNGETLEFGKSRTKRDEAGTTVSVRDIFYKYPVRRKSLSTLTAQQTTICQIRSQLSIISLAHPRVSFHLVDTSSQQPKNLLSVSRSVEGVLGRWKQLWGRAGVEQVWEFERKDVEAGINVKGFISESASHSKSNQFIFIDRQPLSSSASSFHKSLNQTFTSSSFSRYSSSLFTLPHSSPSTSRSASPAQQERNQVSSGRNTPKKTVEKYPIFFFQLEFEDPTSQVDSSFGMGEFDTKLVEFKDEDRIASLLQSIVKEFLLAKGFISATTAASSSSKGQGRRAEKRVRIDVAAEKVKSTLDDSSHGRLRTRKGPQSELDGPRENEPLLFETPAHEQIKKNKTSTATLPALVKHDLLAPPSLPFSSRRPELVVYPNSFSPSSPDPLRWTDPSTGQLFEIDSRTGNSWRYDPIRDRQTRTEELQVGVTDEGDETGGSQEAGTGMSEERKGIVDRRALKRKTRVSLAAAGPSADAHEGDVQKEMPEWLRTTLAKWENPIFPASKPASTVRIPSLAAASAFAHVAPQPNSQQSHIFSSSKTSLPAFSSSKPNRSRSISSSQLTHTRLSKISQFFSTTSSSSIPSSLFQSNSAAPTATFDSQTFSRESLRRAKFIAQIDDKYLLVKLPCSTYSNEYKEAEWEGADHGLSTLVMFDQHAVSERIRVEKYLSELCGKFRAVEVVDLLTSDQGGRIGVVVSREEFRELRLWRTSFERWGFKISQDSLQEQSSDLQGDYVQLWIESVPKLVGQRLKQDSKLLQELIRGYLAQLKDSPPTSVLKSNRDGGGEEEESWVNQVKDCPVGLVELINSKACRGAIMFNDRLRDEQAQALLESLAETKFPFTCAHGRPSIVPLVNFEHPFRLPQYRPQQVAQKSKIDWNRLV
ncbi:hypothetical protein JCM3765_002708 [Sporobolomyces pararoseus]